MSSKVWVVVRKGTILGWPYSFKSYSDALEAMHCYMGSKFESNRLSERTWILYEELVSIVELTYVNRSK